MSFTTPATLVPSPVAAEEKPSQFNVWLCLNSGLAPQAASRAVQPQGLSRAPVPTLDATGVLIATLIKSGVLNAAFPGSLGVSRNAEDCVCVHYRTVPVAFLIGEPPHSPELMSALLDRGWLVWPVSEPVHVEMALDALNYAVARNWTVKHPA